MEESEANEVNKIIGNYERELSDAQSKINVANESLASSSFYSGQNENLIVYQLELNDILEKVEHLLRGDVVVEDDKGNLGYKPAKDKQLKVLNEYGVQLIMNVISFYLNRNTILSFYDPDRIDNILYDLGDELSDVIFSNYEKMGMDTAQKKSRYPLLVLNIIHMIESAYKRALEGGEKENIRTARIVTQSDRMNIPQAHLGNTHENKNFNIFKPKTW
jgi:hypothetical protein